MRRETLDPILCSLAASTPRVTPLPGASLRGLVPEHGAVCGIRLGSSHEADLRAPPAVAQAMLPLLQRQLASN